jgi:hypothetical protein
LRVLAISAREDRLALFAPLHRISWPSIGLSREDATLRAAADGAFWAHAPTANRRAARSMSTATFKLTCTTASTPTIKRMLGDSGEDQLLADPRRS